LKFCYNIKTVGSIYRPPKDKNMAELAHFKNFAKLKDTSIEFNDITVLAGKPGTGKSYVMKFQYALMETVSSILNGNSFEHYAFMDSSEHEEMMINFLSMNFILIAKEFFDVSDITEYLDSNNYIESLKILKENENFILENLDEKNQRSLFQSFLSSLTQFSNRQEKSLGISDEEKFHFIFRNLLTSIFGDINQIDTDFIYKDKQVACSYNENILNIQKINLEEDIENSIFVETPLILEFEKFLPKERFKTPYHIDSLLQELNKNYFSFTSEETSSFINSFQKSASKTIEGTITKGTLGFSFESKSGKSFNIVNASSGIKSIGLLQYLVINKTLKKGSVLFWEEPEVHLHPEWQLKMVDLFVELMNAGIKVVFSTHSPYMADYLNAISKKEGYRDRISFNVLDEKDGVVTNHILDDENWDILQHELMDTFEDILWQYL